MVIGRRLTEIVNQENLIELASNLLSDNPRIVTICNVIFLRYSGKHPKDISGELNLSRPTVLKYINEWNKKGLECINDKRNKFKRSTGASKISHTLANEVYELLKKIKTPLALGYNRKNWSCPLLCQCIKEKMGVEISKTAMRRLLMELGFYHENGKYKLKNKSIGKNFLNKYLQP